MNKKARKSISVLGFLVLTMFVLSIASVFSGEVINDLPAEPGGGSGDADPCAVLEEKKQELENLKKEEVDCNAQEEALRNAEQRLAERGAYIENTALPSIQESIGLLGETDTLKRQLEEYKAELEKLKADVEAARQALEECRAKQKAAEEEYQARKAQLEQEIKELEIKCDTQKTIAQAKIDDRIYKSLSGFPGGVVPPTEEQGQICCEKVLQEQKSYFGGAHVVPAIKQHKITSDPKCPRGWHPVPSPRDKEVCFMEDTVCCRIINRDGGVDYTTLKRKSECPTTASSMPTDMMECRL